MSDPLLFCLLRHDLNLNQNVIPAKVGQFPEKNQTTIDAGYGDAVISWRSFFLLDYILN